jgi:small-conductance mechanosensitive channel
MYLQKCVEEEEKKFLEKKRYFLVTDFAPSSINITVVFKVPFEHLAFLKTHLVNAIFKRLPDKDIEIAYPHMKLVFKKERGGKLKKEVGVEE